MHRFRQVKANVLTRETAQSVPESKELFSRHARVRRKDAHLSGKFAFYNNTARLIDS